MIRHTVFALLVAATIAPTASANSKSDAPTPHLVEDRAPSYPRPYIQPVSDAERRLARAILAKRRAAHMKELAAYAKAGRFPKNIYQPGQLHVFMGEDGALCAVAELMSKSGSHPLVVQTAQANNFIKLGEVTQGPLLQWIHSSGFTHAEIALIQGPNFMVVNDPSFEELEKERVRAHVAAVALQLHSRRKKSLNEALDTLSQNPRELRALINANAGN